MERLHYHNDCNEVTMETRTFRIVPVRRGAEIEVIDVLQKQTFLPNSEINYKFNEEEEDDDALIIAAPPSSNASSSRKLREVYSRQFPTVSDNNADARDDEASPPTVLRSYNRKDHRSPKCQPQDHQKAFTETEKRIAQLRSAGLEISSRGISSPRSQKVHEEERDAPPPSPISEIRSKKSSSLQALLEKDSMHQQRYLASSPPLPRSLQKWSKTSNAFPSVSPPSFSKLARDHTPVDPIIAARPSYKGLRVSLRDYPDPSSFGWAFVGGCLDSKVEYFEKVFAKGKVVLEFHYTTGTVRATLQHTSHGESLLAFCMGGLSSKIYRKILLDPLGCSQSGMAL